MCGKVMVRSLVLGAALFATGLLVPNQVLAHCDGMDGPVVQAAREALTLGNVNLVLIWVQPEDEDAIRSAFQQTLAVRKLSPDARELVDLYFFETLVRLHRAGEGAPYTGVKPAGRDLGPVIPAADKAIADGLVESLLKLLPQPTHVTVREHFREVLTSKNFPVENVAAGRRYVAAYVAFMHAVERLHGLDSCDAEQDGHKCGEAADQDAIEAYRHEPAPSHEHAAAGQQQHTAAELKPRHEVHSRDVLHNAPVGHVAEVTVPRPLKVEHEELHALLFQATKEGGKTAAAAEAVAQLLHPHFVKEEEYALPPLGLLAPLAQGKVTNEMQKVVALTDRLKAELPEMLAEHRGIVAALGKLSAAANAEGKPQYARFAEKLKLHAQTEEEVLYPAAILVGEYLKLKASDYTK